MVVSMVVGAGPAAQMGAGAAMLITVVVVFVGLILLDFWQKRRARRREEARIAAGGAPAEDDGKGADAAARTSLWAAIFGPAAGEERPYNPMDDLHPDELEGQYDGDPPPRGDA